MMRSTRGMLNASFIPFISILCGATPTIGPPRIVSNCQAGARHQLFFHLALRANPEKIPGGRPAGPQFSDGGQSGVDVPACPAATN